MKETRWKHSVRNAISLKEWWTFTIKRNVRVAARVFSRARGTSQGRANLNEREGKRA